jgi:Ca2+-binding EF-hand superfamily protein
LAAEKEKGKQTCELRVVDPRKAAAAASKLATMKADASANASAKAMEAAAKTEKSKLRQEAARQQLKKDDDAAKVVAESESLMSRLRSAFRVFDRNRVGTISQADLVALFEALDLQGLVAGPAGQELLGKVLEHGLDARSKKRKDKRLDAEACRVLVETAKMAKVFGEVDADDNGFIVEEELGLCCAKLGFELEANEVAELLKKVDSDSDGHVSLSEFLSFFRHVGLGVKLRAEAEATRAKNGTVATLDLTKPLGMVVNPNGVVARVTPNGQGESMGVTPGCMILEIGEAPAAAGEAAGTGASGAGAAAGAAGSNNKSNVVTDLASIKAAVGALKKRGVKECPLRFRDPRRAAFAAAKAAQLKAEASRQAAAAASAAEEAAAKAKHDAEEARRLLEEENEKEREEAKRVKREQREKEALARKAALQRAVDLAEATVQAVADAEAFAELCREKEKEAHKQEEVAAELRKRRGELVAAAKAEKQVVKDALRLKRMEAEAKVRLAFAEDLKLKRQFDEAQLEAKAEAVQWWRRGAELGHKEAMHCLARSLVAWAVEAGPAAGASASLDGGKAARQVASDLKEGAAWWNLASSSKYQHAPSMHALAMAYLQRTGVVLRYGTASKGNMERCTELLVKAARLGHRPSAEFLYESQPLTFGSPVDFEPRELPPFAFADTMVGRRVEVVGLKVKSDAGSGGGGGGGSRPAAAAAAPQQQQQQQHELNGTCGTVVEVKPAAGKLEVELDDGRRLFLPRRNLRRPFLAPLDESLAQQAPEKPKTVDFILDPSMPMGLEAEFDTLCVSKVLPQGQAWEAGLRAGATIVAVGGLPVRDLEAAAEAYELARARGEEACAVSCLVDDGSNWRIF